MNCEAIMIFKPNPKEKAEPETLAFLMQTFISENIELYPVAVSQITTETKCYPSYDAAQGYRPKTKKTTLFPGDYVLFIHGKLHHMNKNTMKRFLTAGDKQYLSHFEIIHPDAYETFFEDIITY
jgi:hypothetical protein